MRTALPIAVAALLVGCSQPKLLRHYETLVPDPRPSNLVLSIFPTNPAGAESPTLISGLSERGQAELIRTLAAKMPKTAGAKDLAELLQAPPEEERGPCAWAIKDTVKRRLNISLLGDLRRPADRVDKVDFTLTLRTEKSPEGKELPPRASFISWDKFESKNVTYEIGSATVTQSSKLTLGNSRSKTSNLPESAGSLVKALDIGAETDRTWEESAKYALTRLSVGSALTPRTARLVQEGGPNVTLFGASSATITVGLELDRNPRGVYALTLRKQGKMVRSSEVAVQRCDDRFPNSSKEIVADISGSALIREVSSGDGTIPEGDDHARMRRVPLSGVPVQLIGTKSLKIYRFGLAHCAARAEPEDCDYLQIERDAIEYGGAEPIVLPSVEDAEALRAWLVAQLKARPVKEIGSLPIGLAPVDPRTTSADLRGLTGKEAKQLRVMKLWEN